nr:hypothetical protein [uncultured Pseudoxanthomonas sp.]
MRLSTLLCVFLLTACGSGGAARGGDAPTCASVAAKQRTAENVDEAYEEIRQRTVTSPTEKNQQKLSEAATESAAANAALEAAKAEQAAGRCPPD